MQKRVFLWGCLVLWSVWAGKVHAQKNTTFTSIEEALRQPEKVEVLDLGGQKLRTLPADLFRLTRLKKLVLYGNELRELPADIAKLTQLETLDLYDNKLQDLPLALASLGNLTRLDVGNNRLREIPACVFSLQRLEKLYLYGNRLKTLAPDIERLQALKELRLGGGFRFLWNGNKIKHLPENIGSLQNLEELHLPDNQLKTLPASFNNLKKLQMLELLHNRFRRMPAPLLQMPHLHSVSIWDRRFSKAHKAEVAASLPNTHVVYEPTFEGNMTVLSLALGLGRYTHARVGLHRIFRKDFFTFGAGVQGGYQISSAYSAELSAWANGLAVLSVGLGAIHYGQVGKEQYKQATGFSPEIGFGETFWRIYYKYALAFGTFKDYNRHSIQAQVFIPLR